MMMTFERTGNVQTATNSIKPVMVLKRSDNQFILLTPEGGLDHNFLSAGPFVDFESAKRNAEMTVGVRMNWEIV